MHDIIVKFGVSPTEAEKVWELKRRYPNPIRNDIAVQLVKGLITEQEALKMMREAKRKSALRRARRTSKKDYRLVVTQNEACFEAHQKGDFYSKGIRLPGSFGKSQK